MSADLPLDRLDRLVLEGWARRRGGAPVIVDGDVRLTAAEATALVVEATAFLSHLVGSAASPAAAGQPGPVVAVQATNRWEVMALAVAAWGAGATVLLVPARAGRAALAHALEATGPV
ncbi:MAG TPA: AMP-binding protein, partial [Acidimicrobiales bacterium]